MEMPNWLLDDIGYDLAKKPFERVSWWWVVKWNTFISIDDSPLTVDNPLWLREENSLESVRLFGLHPSALQGEIIHYWQQAFWVRRLLDLFTPIQNKIKLWSYYQRCLSFHEVYVKNPFEEKEPINFVFEKYLGKEARNRLKRCRAQFENHIEKRAGNEKWIKNNEFFLCCHFKKDWDFFVKLMKKKLTRLSSESDRNDLQSQFEKEYGRLQDILVRYLSKWSKKIFTPLSSHGISNSNALVPTDSSSIGKKSNYLSIYNRAGNNIYSIESIEYWIKRQRQAIEFILQEKSPEQFFKIKGLFESCFSEVRLFVDAQLRHYKKMIDRVKQSQFDCVKASQQAEILLTDLIYFFRKIALLFHPDKSFGNKNLQEIQTELFKAFQKLSKESLEKIKEGFPLLQDCLSKQKNIRECWKLKQEFDLRTAEMERQIEEMRAEWEEDKARWRQDFAERKADLKRTRIKMEEVQVKINEFIKSQANSKFIQKLPSSDLTSEKSERTVSSRYESS